MKFARERLLTLANDHDGDMKKAYRQLALKYNQAEMSALDRKHTGAIRIGFTDGNPLHHPRSPVVAPPLHLLRVAACSYA